MRARWIVLVVIAWVALTGGFGLGAVHADTGGSMGGGSWSSSSSGGGGGYSSSGGGYSSSGGGDSSSGGGYSSYDSSSSGGGSLGVGGTVALIVVMVIIWGIGAFIEQAKKHSNLSLNLGGGVVGVDYVDVSVVRVALDGRARKFVQGELARIGKIADTGTADGRAAMLREVTTMLRRARDAWVYGGAVNEPIRAIGNAKAAFDRHVDDARARFRHETVRNEQGVVTTARAPASIPRSHEGEGLILVSIIVAARSELFTVRNIGTGEDLRKALEAASYRSASDLVAIEIVWQPSEADDRLSSIELEAKYPRPDLIPITNALVGKVFCSYCGGPFPAELVSCPHCGAPAPGRESTLPRAA